MSLAFKHGDTEFELHGSDTDESARLGFEIACAVNRLLLPNMAKVESIAVLPIPGEDKVDMRIIIGPIISGDVH